MFFANKQDRNERPTGGGEKSCTEVRLPWGCPYLIKNYNLFFATYKRDIFKNSIFTIVLKVSNSQYY